MTVNTGVYAPPGTNLSGLQSATDSGIAPQKALDAFSANNHTVDTADYLSALTLIAPFLVRSMALIR